MTDEKRPSADLLFTLRAPLSEEDVRAGEEARRRIAAQVLAACVPNAEAIEAMRASWAGAIAFASLARVNVPDLSGLALAVAHVAEESARMASLMVSAIAGVSEQVRESVRIFGETVAAMPEDEREELGRAFEDAPLESVDVNAEGLM
jgi:hypothetical protein